jgi:hypothetical protein
MKNNKFRVLIVDDKKPVLDAMKDWIEHKMIVGNEEFIIELNRLHVNVIDAEIGYKITDGTYQLLDDFCNSQFNLILLDFGFVKEGVKAVDKVEELHQKSPQKTKRELLDNIVLNPSNLVEDVLNSEYNFKKIKKNFIEYTGNMYIYTFIPNKLEQDYTCADVRKNVTNKHFPNAIIKIIDSRKELFNNSEFGEKSVTEYYPFLISKFLSKIIQLEIAEYIILRNTEIKFKFDKIRRNNKLMAISIILPSIIAGIFIPSLFTSFEKGDYLIAVSLLVALLLITFVFTIGTRYFEKQQEKWMK